MSEITADQYRVNALLDIIADNARRDAETLMNERLKHAVELQQARASMQPTPSEPAPVEGPASAGESDESEASSEA